MPSATQGEKQLTSERTMEQMEYFMEHIMQRHVQPFQYRENGYSWNIQFAYHKKSRFGQTRIEGWY